MKSRLLIYFAFLLFSLGVNAQFTTIGLIGDATAGSWDTDTPMNLIDSTNQIWHVTTTLTAASAKFRADADWAVNWGSAEYPAGTGTQGGPNIPISVGGEYDVYFYAITGVYFFDYTGSNIGIIGSATLGDWNKDIIMLQDATDSSQYTVTQNLKPGGLKFRQDKGWDINWGLEAFPEGISTLGGKDIPVPAAGKYFIEFNKTTGAYKFTELVSFKSIGLIGTAINGNWDTEVSLKRDANNADLWKGNIVLGEGEFKFRADSAWTVSWGGTTFPSGIASTSDGNLVITADKAGEYQCTFNSNTLEYSFLAIGNYSSIGLIGSATPGSWDTESKMTQSTTDKSVWTLRIKLVDGEAKFRANDAWDISWGGEGFPSGVGLTDNGPNIPVVAGDYKITFNSTTGAYEFVAVIEFDNISIVGKTGPFGEWPGSDDSKDTYMDKDPADANHWTAKNVELTDFAATTDGGIKFRANAAWTTNWGAKDFPAGTGTQNGANIETVAGKYNVDFRSDTGAYAFTGTSSSYDLLSNDVIAISPNPASNQINIKVNTDALKGDVIVSIFNVNGQQVARQLINVNGIAQVNTSALEAGNYLVRISNNNSVVAKPIVIVK